MKKTQLLTRIGSFAVRRRRLVLSFTVLFMVIAGVLGTRAFGVLPDEGFEDPGSESFRADELVGERFGGGESDIVIVATAAGGDVDAPDAVAAGTTVSAQIAAFDGVDTVTSYWSANSPPTLRSEGGDAALVLVDAQGGSAEDVLGLAEDLADASEEQGSEVTLAITGGEAIGNAFGETIEGDLARAESIAVPITLVLLVLVFGGLLAAGLPLLVGVIAVLGTFLSLFVIGSVTDVSVFAINLTTALGLGLAIDYSLFIVSRYREELAAERTVEGAVIRAVETAGRTIAIGALTVAVSLSALLLFPMYFLRSFAYAGIAVVLTAMAASLLSLPALLAVVGTRIDSLRLFRHRTHRLRDGFWYRTAKRVMRRPAAVGLAVVAVLLLLGTPFLRAEFGNPDARMLPESSETRQATEALQAGFSGDASEAFPVVLDGAGDVAAALDGLAVNVSGVDGIDRVETVTGTYSGGERVAEPGPASAAFADGEGGWMSVVPSIEMGSPEGQDLIAEVRDLPADGEMFVGGDTAGLIDTRSAIADRLPLGLGLIALATTVLLFLLSGSLLVPLKAMILNLLSLTATFGAMVWIFQDGNLSGVLGFTETGTLDTTTPILMFCIAFGLSMDYEVFLLSRIKEEHDRTGDNDEAVAIGLEKTGGIVTAAAAVLSVTFLAFGTSGVSFIKMFGIGLAIAVLMDAFVIRGTLVPAFMKLAGNANWWAPAPLRRLHERFGIREDDDDDGWDGDQDGEPLDGPDGDRNAPALASTSE